MGNRGTLPGKRLSDLQPFWQRVRARAGVKDVRIHDPRHTFASTTVASGQGLPMIGKLLGHTQVQTTARYAHLAAEPVRMAADAVAQDLREALGERVGPSVTPPADAPRLLRRASAPPSVPSTQRRAYQVRCARSWPQNP